MKLLHNNRLILNVDFIVNNNGQPYYQRGIPKDLQERFGKKIFKIKLDSNNRRKTVQQQALAYKKTHDTLFNSLRKNPELTATETKLNAIALLQNFGLSQGDAEIEALLHNDLAHDSHLLDKYADFHIYYNKMKEQGQLTKVDEVAMKALQTPLPLMLTEAADIYLKFHPKGQQSRFIKDTKVRWNKFVEITGDIPLMSLTRATAKKFIEKRSHQKYGKDKSIPIKTNTIQREIKTIQAVIAKVTREEEINLRNPFEAMTVQGLGSDRKVREPLTKRELSKLLNRCIDDFDEIRCLIILQACTGARISEIAGLRIKDIHTHEGITYISIKEYGKRTVKTKHSVRNVPLIELALNALNLQLTSLDESAKAIFPRYADGTTVNSDGVSATVNKYIRSIGIDKTSHCLRHTLRDLLRHANVTVDIAHEIGGWGSQAMAEMYGRGHDISVKYDALTNALSHIQINKQLPKKITLKEAFKQPSKAIKTIPMGESLDARKTAQKASESLSRPHKTTAKPKPRRPSKSNSTVAQLARKLGRKVTAKDIAEFANEWRQKQKGADQ